VFDLFVIIKEKQNQTILKRKNKKTYLISRNSFVYFQTSLLKNHSKQHVRDVRFS